MLDTLTTAGERSPALAFDKVRAAEGALAQTAETDAPAAYRRALAAGDAWHGTTVHFVVPELDAGPAILQYRVRVAPGESEDALRQRVQRGEYLVYPRAIGWLASGRLVQRDGRAWLDGRPLDAPVVVDEAPGA